jgi:hypothetical protein
MGVPESRIVAEIRKGTRSLKGIGESTKAGTGTRCKELHPQGRCCSCDIIAIIERETGGSVDSNGCCCE